MKKLTFIAATLAAILSSCSSQSEQFTLQGQGLPADLNGQYIDILKDVDQKIDSILVKDGAFTYTTSVDTTHFYVLRVNERNYPIVFEPGTVTLTPNDSDKTYTLTGSKYLDKLTAFNQEINKMSDFFQALQDSTSSDSSKDEEIRQREYKKIENQYHDMRMALTQKWYSENKDNVIGLAVFLTTNFDNDSLFLAAYENSGDHIKEFPVLKTRYDILSKAAQTGAGNHYTDFTIVDPEGQTVKLSSFKQADRYLLVDFWASWCLPCRKAMPHLAELVKKYSDKGLDVLSIGCSDTEADYKKAVEDLNITWDCILDTNNTGSKTYGIKGIPTLLLISPEGKIIIRTHRPDEVTAKIEELLN